MNPVTSALPLTVPELVKLIASGAMPKYVLFWGHSLSKDGGVTKACFSQWWPASFEEDGIRYSTAEHYMMAAKARLFDDRETLVQILAATHPQQAKKLGRQVQNFDEEKWLAQRFGLVVAGNELKFRQHPDLAAFLIGTGERILVEASPVDSVWGIGLAQDHASATTPVEWRGLNLLGFALMEVRRRLMESR